MLGRLFKKDKEEQHTANTIEKQESQGLISKLKLRLEKSRKGFMRQVDDLLFGKSKIDDELLDELEELLVTGDISVSTVEEIFSQVRSEVARSELQDGEALKTRLKAIISSMVKVTDHDIPWEPTPYCILMVGVNGVGKTTTIAKLGYHLKNQGKKVLFVASDTFRAAAIEQLQTWGERLDIPVIHHSPGADPSAVAFDGIQAALKRQVDVVLIDTAGRLHTKVNLMEELKKIRKVIGKRLDGAPHEVLLVLDATTGQNALNQARQFHEVTPLTGIILTKLDGTARGGIVVSITNELKLPIRFIGIGEKMEDLEPFEPEVFVDALFSK
ncbi:Signal recognition particle receptor protein FtsY (alpha subunit) [Dissulfuribacter thermophilus]|uniref:Signal recognition particle receptor FtsY n=1 Tax=Dissulfuribacter thermophilus TaxID=1156395 RepID=A0A1B9F455_9BACT|nr:signal recognition particle-docking protein FtsY [Dissulfuribacter thermophilus]OCC14710.1 Signal recognition particle receptor protein FtsY (alpha subunit) [Dissulfuribacter thermophilus]